MTNEPAQPVEYLRGRVTRIIDHYQPGTGRRTAVIVVIDHTPGLHRLGLPCVIVVRYHAGVAATDRYRPGHTHVVAWGTPTVVTSRNGDTLRALDAWTINRHRPDRPPPHPTRDPRAHPPGHRPRIPRPGSTPRLPPSPDTPPEAAV